MKKQLELYRKDLNTRVDRMLENEKERKAFFELVKELRTMDQPSKHNLDFGGQPEQKPGSLRKTRELKRRQTLDKLTSIYEDGDYMQDDKPPGAAKVEIDD